MQDILVNIGSGNGLVPVRRQAITWINADLLTIRPLETNFSEILIKIQRFSFKKMHLKMSSAKCQAAILFWPQCGNKMEEKEWTGLLTDAVYAIKCSMVLL